MPVTRRKRATSPDENTNQVTEVTNQAGENTASAAQEAPGDTGNTLTTSEQPASTQPATAENLHPQRERTHTRRVRREEPARADHIPEQADVSQAGKQPQQTPPQQLQQPLASTSTAGEQSGPVSSSSTTQGPSSSTANERPERTDYTPTIEPGRRTARGELFRRPPQIPAQHSSTNHQGGAQQTPTQPASSAPVQASQPHNHVSHTPTPPAPPVPPTPTHEISLPLGNLLHLAYNPGYTGADEARSTLLHQLASESKAGGRARCWNCGSLAVIYDRWSTRSKNFGEVGVAMCEICGVWSVM